MKILDHEITIRNNLLFSFKTYRVWWLILLVTIIFDHLTTLYFVNKLGLDAEGNKVIRWLIQALGLNLGVLIGKTMQLATVLLAVSVSQKVGNFFLLFVIILNCWAVVMNTIPNY